MSPQVARAVLTGLLLALATYLLALPVLTTASHRGRSDIMRHIDLLMQAKAHGRFILYTSYYTLLDTASGGSMDPDHLRRTAVQLLAWLEALKVLVVFAMVWALSRRIVHASVAGVLSILAMPLAFDLTGRLYIGRFTPVNWHNSTTILLMPLSVLTFWAVTEVVLDRRPHRWALWSVVPLVLLDVFAKPNFMIAFLPGLGLVVLVRAWIHRRERRTHELARLGVVGAISLVILVAQYIATFMMPGLTASRLTIDPGAVWRLYGNPPLLALASLLPAVVAQLALGRRPALPRLVWPAWATLLVAITEFTVGSEVDGGHRTSNNGNWLWGSHVALLVVYVVLVASWARRPPRRGPLRTATVLLVAWQVVVGLAYLLHLLFAPSPGFL